MKLNDQKKLLIALAIGFLCFYFGKAGIDAFVFKSNSFLEELTFSTGNLQDIFVHLLVISEFVVFGIFFYRVFVRRNLAENKLRESEQRWATTLTSIGDAVISTNFVGEITFLNAEAEKLTGWTLHEASCKPLKTVFKIINEFTRLEVDNPISKVLETGRTAGLANHTILVRKDGTEVAIDDSAAPIRVEGGKIAGVVLVFRDISERRRAERELTDLKNFNEAIVESISETLLVIDPNDYRIIAVNGEAERELGLREEDLVGKTCYEVTHNFSTPCEAPHDCPLKEALATGKVATANHVHFDKDQNRTYVEISVYPIRNQDGKITNVVHLARNVTERKEAEEELKTAANIFDLATDSIFVHDTEGNIVNFNEAAYKLRGYTKEEMAKMNIRELDNPDSATLVEPRIKLLVENSNVVFESVHVRKDKTLLPVEIHARTIDLQGKKLALAVARDISERKKAEEALTEVMDQLVLVNEKLGVVGSLTRHDVRNKLSAVTGYAYLLKKKHADQIDIVEGLDKMEKAVEETVRIFDFAKMYEQLGAEQLTPINVDAKLNEATTLFSGQLPEIINECHGLTVLADSFLRQLFYNFIDNTRKYGKKTTTIKVFYEKADQDNLKLVYEDDGVGVPLENKPRLFKEGFSTGGSTGYGLFLIKKMIDAYGWKIEENGEPGIGAKFVITIPKLNKNGKENYRIAPYANRLTKQQDISS